MFSKTNPLYQYSMNSLIFSILYKIFQSTRQNLAEWSEKIRIRHILCRSERDWIEVSLKFKIFPFESIIAKNGRKKSIERLDDIICQMSMFLFVMKVSSRYFVDNQCFPELRRLYLLKLTGERQRRKKSTVYKYQKPNFPREIQASKLDESSATKRP